MQTTPSQTTMQPRDAVPPARPASVDPRAAAATLRRLLADVQRGPVPLDRDLARSRRLDRIELAMRLEHGATLAIGRAGQSLEIAGLRVALTGPVTRTGFGRLALFRAWLRAAECARAGCAA